MASKDLGEIIRKKKKEGIVLNHVLHRVTETLLDEHFMPRLYAVAFRGSPVIVERGTLWWIGDVESETFVRMPWRKLDAGFTGITG